MQGCFLFIIVWIVFLFKVFILDGSLDSRLVLVFDLLGLYVMLKLQDDKVVI